MLPTEKKEVKISPELMQECEVPPVTLSAGATDDQFFKTNTTKLKYDGDCFHRHNALVRLLRKFGF